MESKNRTITKCQLAVFAMFDCSHKYQKHIYHIFFQQQCDKYWGDVLSVQKYVRQGDIHICLDSILELSKLVIRTFHIQKVGWTTLVLHEYIYSEISLELSH